MNWCIFTMIILVLLIGGSTSLSMGYRELTDKIRGYNSDCLFRNYVTFKELKELYNILKTNAKISDYEKRIIREFLLLQLFALICGIAFIIIVFFGNW